MTIGRQRIPSPLERRRRNRQEMETAILAAAREVMREEGVAALNLSEVARRVGVKTPSLYGYFASRMDLYDALFRVGLRTYAELIGPVAARPPSWEQMEAAMHVYMNFAHDSPELFSLVFERQVPGFVPSNRSMRESEALLQEGFGAIQRMIDAGLIVTRLPVEHVFDLFNAMMHGLASAQVANAPQHRAGEGRFGQLISEAVTIFRAAWAPEEDPAGGLCNEDVRP